MYKHELIDILSKISIVVDANDEENPWVEVNAIVPRLVSDEKIMPIKVLSECMSPIKFVITNDVLTVIHSNTSVVEDYIYMLTFNPRLSDDGGSILHSSIQKEILPTIDYENSIRQRLIMQMNAKDKTAHYSKDIINNLKLENMSKGCYGIKTLGFSIEPEIGMEPVLKDIVTTSDDIRYSNINDNIIFDVENMREYVNTWYSLYNI